MCQCDCKGMEYYYWSRLVYAASEDSFYTNFSSFGQICIKHVLTKYTHSCEFFNYIKCPLKEVSVICDRRVKRIGE